MNHRSSFFPSLRAAVLAGAAVAMMAMPMSGYAQDNAAPQTTTDTTAQPQADATLQASPESSDKKSKKNKDEKVVKSKDTVKHMREAKKTWGLGKVPFAMSLRIGSNISVYDDMSTMVVTPLAR